MSTSFESKLRVGTTKEREITVASNMTTSFLWEGENVLSTPALIMEIEETCRLLLKEQAIPESDWDSVGTIVNIKHLSATPVGAQVFLKAEVISVDNRRVMFEVEARDELDRIGEGRHERFIINVPKFRAKFDKKARRLGM